MPKSYLNSEPYGIGELIARKKHLKVPSHQRDYAWGEDEVDTLLEDLFDAVDSNTEEYFLGLIVLIGPIEGAWTVLDGQQRLATCTMVLSAIAFWLQQLGREDDSNQIQRQFISVRRLGGEDEPRLQMNHTNREIFLDLLRASLDTDEIRQRQLQHSPGTSNHRLITAFLTCRIQVGKAMKERQGSDQGAFLYRLADFLENQALAVCLEVDQAADAYRIFESLNDRGMALSALDLFKNFAFGVVHESRHSELAELWEEMASQIADADAEDFLKVVWTARFGRVQRGALFSMIKREYETEDAVLDLVRTLSVQAELYTAVFDPSHHAWAEYSPQDASIVGTLRDLRARQVRPIILAALTARVERWFMSLLLRNLLTLTVRYQTIGRRRTGLMEIACAKAAREISASALPTFEALSSLESLVPSDDEFVLDFERYRERNAKRAMHVLLGIESLLQHSSYRPDWVHEALASEAMVVTPLISPSTPPQESAAENDPGFVEDVSRRIGNLFLLTREEATRVQSAPVADALAVIRNATFASTSATIGFAHHMGWGRREIQGRQSTLANFAVRCWVWERQI